MSRERQVYTRPHESFGIQSSRTFPLILVYAFWVLMIFEIDWFLTAATGGPFYRVPALLVPVLGLLILQRRNKRAVYWPLILFTMLHLGASLFAENAGLSRGGLKFMLYMVVLFGVSVSFVDSPSKIIVILQLYLLHFAWYGVQGLANGFVFWHPLMANEDSYGPLMVMGMAFSYFFALATPSWRWRWLARGLFLLSIAGVIRSFARGAAIGSGVVLLYIVLRSPRRALTGLILSVVVLLPVTTLIFPTDSYLARLKTVTSEGADAGTGRARWVLWQHAWMVFRGSPVYGVGASNFGVVASRLATLESLQGAWSDPAQLYFMAIHNVSVQILAEEGIIGIVLWIGMIVGALRRGRRLETENAIAQWKRLGGEGLDLRMILRGLEGAMVGYLTTSFFYNQLYIHWFWSLVTIAYVLSEVTRVGSRVTEGAKRQKGQPWGRNSEVEK